jgi:hypothetical protein
MTKDQREILRLKYNAILKEIQIEVTNTMIYRKSGTNSNNLEKTKDEFWKYVDSLVGEK